MSVQPARVFMDSLGLNIDLGTRSSRNANREALLADLRALGVRHIKADALGVTAASLADHQVLIRHGIDVMLQLNTRSDVAALVRDIGPSLRAVQIPTPDDGGSLSPSVSAVGELTSHFSQQVGELPSSQRPLIVGPRLGRDAAAVQDLSRWVDRGGLRYGFRPPGAPELARAIDEQRTWFGAKALWATAGGGFPLLPGSSEAPVPVRVQAKYVLRFFLELYRHGVERAYYTKLYDNEAFGYGLATAEGERRPAFLAMQALASVMRDESEPASVRPLGLALEDSDPASLHHLLFQRSDGMHVLLLWLEMPSEQEDQARMVTVRVDPKPSATTYRVLDDPAVEPVRLPTGDVTVMVKDFPVALELETVCR